MPVEGPASSKAADMGLNLESEGAAMKLSVFIFVSAFCLGVLFCGFVQAADGPDQIGGFVLGDDISRYKETVDLMSALPIRYADYLREVVIRDVPGFKTGQIYYGMCENPGKILRIRLKYLNSTKAFFEELLERITSRFGKPSEWRGDPFGVVIAWKWSMKTKGGRRVSLIIQHNTLDDEEAKGNTIKLALTGMMEAERACYLELHPEKAKARADAAGDAVQRMPDDWSLLVPR
jgi:hypothetical protein